MSASRRFETSLKRLKCANSGHVAVRRTRGVGVSGIVRNNRSVPSLGMFDCLMARVPKGYGRIRLSQSTLLRKFRYEISTIDCANLFPPGVGDAVMSSVWGKLFGNRPTPANDAHHLLNHYEPDNETSEAWDASSNGWGHGHRRGGDPMPAMIARTLTSKLAEPLLPAEPAPDALLRLGPLARRGAGEPLLRRRTPAALSSASPEFVQSYASSATEEPGLPHRAVPWRLAGWGVLGVGAPSLVALAIVMLSPALRPPTPLESTDQATHPRAPPAAPAIPRRGHDHGLAGGAESPVTDRGGRGAGAPRFQEGMAVPPSAIAVSPAPPPATSPHPHARFGNRSGRRALHRGSRAQNGRAVR